MNEDEVRVAVEYAYRTQWARVFGATTRLARDLDLAEECVQDAFAEALRSWARDGVPMNAGAWLTSTAKRRVIDTLRRHATYRSKLPLLIETESPSDGGTSLTPTGNVTTEEFVRDDALRLVFMCCHPSLSSEAQVALTLRLVCGVATPDIARCFLVSESTMAARLTRAKKKISVARIPFTVPRLADMPERLSAVLGVIYLLFTVGHTSPTGNQLLQTDAIAEAIRLTRLLHDLVPNEPEVAGLLALLIVNDSRRASRLGEGGRSIRISEQDRSRWDQALIREARHLIDSHLGPRGQYALQAQIALLHAEAPTFDDVNWRLILRTYDELLSLTPSPVIELNRAVAVSKTQGSEVALGIVRRLETDGHLARSQYLPAVKAYLLDQLGRHDEANAERTRALGLTSNEVERASLAKEIH